MAPSLPLVTALFTAARAHLDESSMLQMLVKNQDVVVDDDACRCPGYFEAECTAEAAQGCVWSSQGSSNGPWCQCLGDAVPVPITPVTLPPVTLPPVHMDLQVVCDVDACFARCESFYGGSLDTGDAYYCAKGCAPNSASTSMNSAYYCNVNVQDRESTCLHNVDSGASEFCSSISSNHPQCEFGCGFWTLPPVTAPPVTEPVDDESFCAAQCQAAGNCCNDPSVGSNQQISCAQACMMRASGQRMDAMLSANGGICNRAGNSGCSLEVQGQSYSFCQSCQDLQEHCPHGVQSSDECDFGASLLPPSAVVDPEPTACESEWVFPGKGCPPSGTCLNGNTPYSTWEEAWAQCEQVSECGNILHWTNGNYYLRRDTDPAWTAGHTLSHCPGVSAFPPSRPECGSEQPFPSSPGKGCPPGGSCLNGNTPYSTLEEAWAQCELVNGCGNILRWTNGNYYLRRDTDPDVTSATEGVHSTTPFCLGMIHSAPTPPEPSSQCTYSPGDGVGGTEQHIGAAGSPEECAAMVREQCPYANGATLESGGSGRCYCEFHMSGWNSSPSWQSCMFEDFEEEQVIQCEGGHYVTGDGVGGTERYIGDASSPQECVQMVDEQCPDANGATLASQGSGRCYCEFGMTDQNDSGSWQTCQFAFDGQMLKCNGADHYQCASQDEAQQRCAEIGLNLCPAADIERHIGRVCAYMWTSDSTTTGYLIGNGVNGCGGASNNGNMLSSSVTYGGVAMFNAACCD